MISPRKVQRRFGRYPSAKPGRRARGTLAVLAAVVTAALVVPLPLLVLTPGAALPVADRLTLDHPRDEVTGEILLTTVRIGRASLAEAVKAWVDDDEDVVRRQALVPEGLEDEEHFEAQRRLFAETADVAAAAGLRLAGLQANLSGEGARVVSVVPGSPADGNLQPDDVVTAVDGVDVDLASDLATSVGRAVAGEAVTLEYRRGDEVREVRLEVRDLTELGRPGLGVAIETLEPAVDLPFPVEIDQDEIGGPSAGLAIALTVYDLIDEDDLTDGRKVAVTGTIDAVGAVGPVGGVTQKAAAAADAGAELFLVPPAELAEARDAAEGQFEVVSVSTLEEAVAVLDRETTVQER